MNKTIRTMMLALTAAFAVSVSANAATFVVNTTTDTQDATPGDGICADSLGACSLRAAITEANALAGADIITLPAGTYTETIPTTNENGNLNGDFDILSDLTINGAGAATTIIQANAAPNTATDRVIHCLLGSTAVVLNDVTIRNGQTVTNSSGAGLRLEGATTNVTLNRVIITANKSAGAGGGVSFLTAGEVLTATNCIISNNSAGSSIAASGSTGAGLNVQVNATVNLNNTTVTGNTITSTVTNTFGAGVNVTGAGANVTMTGCTISNNSSNAPGPTFIGFAGGVYNQNATVNIANSTVTGNSTSGAAGGVQTAIRTLASTGTGTTNITDSTISGNTAPDDAPGVVNIGVSTTGFAAITNITRSTISGNTTASIQSAGAIENFNSAAATGAATVNLLNSTVSGNSAGLTGGIYNDGALASINLNYSTVAANASTDTTPGGGGLYQDATAGGVTNLKNSIVADNTAVTAGPDIFGTITSQGFNHVETTTGGTFIPVAGDVTGSDPVLGPLANNGGPTFTHLPGPTSPVIDTITGLECSSVPLDQRSFARPFGAGCDKGSVEVQPNSLTATSAVSRKMHGGAGIFDINLPLSGTPSVECRAPGAGGAYQIVFTFANPVTTVGGSATPPPTAAQFSGTGFGQVSSVVINGSTVEVNLIGVSDVQLFTVTLYSVTDSTGNNGNASVQVRALIGDTNGNGLVSATDISQTKANSGQVAGPLNFRTDVNMSGSINATDISIVKSKSGNSVPFP